MSKDEVRGLFKGIGITMVICATIFYTLILNYRSSVMSETLTNEEIESKARDIGMIYVTELQELDAISEDYIIKIAKGLGMTFVEDQDDINE